MSSPLLQKFTVVGRQLDVLSILSRKVSWKSVWSDPDELLPIDAPLFDISEFLSESPLDIMRPVTSEEQRSLHRFFAQNNGYDFPAVLVLETTGDPRTIVELELAIKHNEHLDGLVVAPGRPPTEAERAGRAFREPDIVVLTGPYPFAMPDLTRQLSMARLVLASGAVSASLYEGTPHGKQRTFAILREDFPARIPILQGYKNGLPLPNETNRVLTDLGLLRNASAPLNQGHSAVRPRRNGPSIVVLTGGTPEDGFDGPTGTLIIDTLAALCNGGRMCYFGIAKGDDAEMERQVVKSAGSFGWLDFARIATPNSELLDLPAMVRNASAVVFGGGKANVRHEMIRALGLGSHIRNAIVDDKTLYAGFSDGSYALAGGVTGTTKPSLVESLGDEDGEIVVDSVLCHSEEPLRWEAYKQAVASGKVREGIALPTGVMAVYVNGYLRRVLYPEELIATSPKVRHVRADGHGGVEIREIEADVLNRDTYLPLVAATLGKPLNSRFMSNGCSF